MVGQRSVSWVLITRASLVVIALCAVFGVVRSLVGSSTPVDAAASSIPTQAAQTTAVQFAYAYETFDSKNAQPRQQQLAAFMSCGTASTDPSLGWDGAGSQSVRVAIPSNVHAVNTHQLLVTVAILTDSGRWLYLAVPIVVANHGAVAVKCGTPALVPPPHRALWQQPDGNDQTDAALSSSLQPTMAAFFDAYANSNAAILSHFTAPGVAVAGLNGEVRLDDLHLTVIDGTGATRKATATVRWVDKASGAGMDQSYALVLKRLDGKWLVAQVGPQI